MGLLSGLIDFLKCLVLYGTGLLEWALISLFNLLVSTLAALIGPLLGLLPTVDLGSVALPSWVAWANWFLPLDTFAALLTIVVAVLIAGWAVRIALRWIKAVS
ncbi:MAG TPA: hypothetical protein VHZ31_08860 [Solirubrobacteraceae bacterium]|nr:hypothetical protein [Solirubrobacteraceae bacterium]